MTSIQQSPGKMWNYINWTTDWKWTRKEVTTPNYLRHKKRIIHKTTIRKTHLYNFDPLKPHFYIVKLGFTGVYIIFVISAQKYRLWYSLEPPPWGGSNEYPQSMFWAEIWKISDFFYLKIFIFWRWNILYIWIGVFSLWEWTFYCPRKMS